MIIKFPDPNITAENNGLEMRFLKIAELANFYSTLIIMVLGIVSNSFILYILNSKPRTRSMSMPRLSHRNRSGVRSRSLSSSELYMCALAMVDTLFLLSYLLLNRAPSLVNTSDIFQNVHESRIACKLANFLRYSSRLCSSYFVVFFAYERFAAVRRPLERLKSAKNRTVTKASIISVALISILINSYSPLMFELEVETDLETNKSYTICVLKLEEKLLRKLHSPFQFFISFIIPIMLVCFFNISNIRLLLTRKNEVLREGNNGNVTATNTDVNRGGGGNGSNDSVMLRVSNSSRRSSKRSINNYDKLRDSNRATNILILISVCFIGFNLPFVIARTWNVINESRISVAILCLAEILHVANFAIDLPLYCLASKQFRKEFFARFVSPKDSSSRSSQNLPTQN